MASDDLFFSCAGDLNIVEKSARIGTNETLSATSIADFDTQPVSNSIDQSLSQTQQLPPWGLLFGLADGMPQTQLTHKEYVVGRIDGPPVDLVLPRPPESEKSRLNMWLSYSRIQFRIRRNDNGLVEIEDCSSNGTFVNGKRLTKNVPAVLENNSEISLSLTKNRVMMFADLSILDDPNIPLALRNQYRFSKQLGQGACGEVQLAFSRRNGVPVAIKIVHRSRFFSEVPNNPTKGKVAEKKPKEDDKHSSYAQAIREAKLMRELSHPCIIKVIDVFDEPPSNDMFLVLEYAPGGELFDKIVASGKLAEPFAKFIFFQIILAVQYLHANGITHRDLKPENILLSSDEDFPIAKLADFGLSKIVDPGTVLRTYCGTPTYLAPEIVRTKGNGVYSKKVDLWSSGVILFAALAGYPPFYTERADMTLEEQIMNGSYSFPSERWSGVSSDAINLIKCLLTIDPAKRVSADQAVVHSWISSDISVIDKVNDVVFNGRGIKYNFSNGKPPSSRAEVVPVALASRGRGGSGLNRVARGAHNSRLSSARTNESEQSRKNSAGEEETKRPATADGVRPLRRKNIRDSVDPGVVCPTAKITGNVASPSRFGSPMTKRVVINSSNAGNGEVSTRRTPLDHLAAAKTPKISRRK